MNVRHPMGGHPFLFYCDDIKFDLILQLVLSKIYKVHFQMENLLGTSNYFGPLKSICYRKLSAK